MWDLNLTTLPSGSLFIMKDHIETMLFLPFSSILLNKVQCLSFSLAPISFLIVSTDSRLSGWLLDSLKFNLKFTSSMFDTRVLVKLRRFSGYELSLSSWWSSLAAKIYVYGIMDLVADMATDSKRSTRPNNLGILSLLLSFSLIHLLCLSLEMQIFAYSGIGRDSCEGMSWYYPLGEASVSASRLN